ncbi:MAG: helix-turn-helix domain-containing protein [Spirochaetales bacterium]|nr:helix-turn-helix domain-containing protein [Spirochaetales bacterium]
MELFGEKLKEARESKGYSVEQIARETKISKHFIVALENEEFSTFPSETYLIGFLKNYADFLSLEPDRLVTLYRNFKIQEQPIPMDELLNMKKKVSPFFIVIMSLAGIGLVAGILFVLMNFVFSPVTITKVAGEVPVVETVANSNENMSALQEEYLFKEEIVTKVFRQGDSIRFPLKNKDYIFKIQSISDKLEMVYDDQILSFGLTEEKYLDLDKDNQYDLKLTYVGSSENKDAKLMLTKITVSMTAKDPQIDQSDIDLPVVASNSNYSKYRLKNDAEKILVARTPENYNINIEFQNYCLFRYLLDDKLQEQRYFYKDDPLPLSVNREAVLWMSNADAVKLSINGNDIKLGNPGEVKTKLVHWVKNEQANNYSLEIVSIF